MTKEVRMKLEGENHLEYFNKEKNQYENFDYKSCYCFPKEGILYFVMEFSNRQRPLALEYFNSQNTHAFRVVKKGWESKEFSSKLNFESYSINSPLYVEMVIAETKDIEELDFYHQEYHNGNIEIAINGWEELGDGGDKKSYVFVAEYYKSIGDKSKSRDYLRKAEKTDDLETLYHIAQVDDNIKTDILIDVAKRAICPKIRYKLACRFRDDKDLENALYWFYITKDTIISENQQKECSDILDISNSSIINLTHNLSKNVVDRINAKLHFYKNLNFIY